MRIPGFKPFLRILVWILGCFFPDLNPWPWKAGRNCLESDPRFSSWMGHGIKLEK